MLHRNWGKLAAKCEVVEVTIGTSKTGDSFIHEQRRRLTGCTGLLMEREGGDKSKT